MRRHLCCAIALSSSIALHPGCADRDAIAALEQRVAALEQRNRALAAQVEALEQRLAAPPPSSPLAGLLGQALRGGALAPASAPPRARPMDPALQQRLDRVVVDGLEKLAHSDDAKNAVKALLKMIAAGGDPRRGGAMPPPAEEETVGRCQALELGIGSALDAAKPCAKDAECTVERFATCSLRQMHCYAAVFNARHAQQVRDALQAYLANCPERRRCRCRTPERAVCRAGRCAPSL